MKYLRKQQGFTLIELAVVLIVIGYLVSLAVPKFKGASNEPKATALYDFDQAAANNFRLAAFKCGVSSAVATSTLLTTPGATNSLNLIISGTGLNTTYQGCYDDAGLNPLRAKAQGNTTDGFKVSGFTTTWSGGGTSPISFLHANVPIEVAFPLYKKYSSTSGASTATAFPVAAESGDPMINFTDPSSGTTNLTILIP